MTDDETLTARAAELAIRLRRRYAGRYPTRHPLAWRAPARVSRGLTLYAFWCRPLHRRYEQAGLDTSRTRSDVPNVSNPPRIAMRDADVDALVEIIRKHVPPSSPDFAKAIRLSGLLNQAPGCDDWLHLAREAVARFEALPPETRAAHRREQAIDFAFGQLKATTRHGAGVTRERIAEIYDRMRKDNDT